MYRYLEDYWRGILRAALDSTAGYCFATSEVVETPSATLRQDVSSIFTHLDGRLAALAFEPSAKASSDLLDPGEALPPS